MKKTHSVSALVLAVALIATMSVGCGNKAPAATSSEASKSEPSKSEAPSASTAPTKDDLIQAEGNKVSFLYAGYDGTDPNSHFTTAIAAFEAATGKKVEVIQTGEQAWNDKVAANIASGSPIDVVSAFANYIPMYQNGLCAPLDDYVDFTKSTFDMDATKALGTYGGKIRYAVTGTSPYVMFYNNDILTANGLEADAPRKAMAEGKWTWDAWKKMAKTCHNPEGTGIDGFQNMYGEAFLATNNVSAVTLGADNKYALNISNPRFRETLELIQDINYTNRIVGCGWIDGQNAFINGKAAFHGTYCYDEATFAKAKKEGTLKFDFGVVEFPYGPTNPDKVNLVHFGGEFISTGSKAPYSAGRLIEFISQAIVDKAAKKEYEPLPYSEAMYQSMRAHPMVVGLTDSFLSGGFGAFYLMNDIEKGGEINAKLAEFEPLYQ
ncbi:MAG: extracellular solute-binding protein, partial [Angelakisella sp.]